MGSGDSQKSGSSTSSRARSHSWPAWATLAGKDALLPCRWTVTKEESATKWALVRMARGRMTNPVPVDSL
eukprot:scaffold671782_cov39-Prasinocladus_malaysianus.AAC.1